MGTERRVAARKPWQRESQAQDAWESATLLSLLLFLWGLISLLVLPRLVFAASNVIEVLAGAVGLFWFIRTRNAPSTRAAVLFSVVVLAGALTILPWTSMTWLAMGRPLEAFTVPNVAVVVMAFVIPRYVWLGAVALCLFAAQSFFAFFHARHAGQGDLLPITEPYATVAMATFGLILLVLRDSRRRISRRYVHIQGEIQALRAISPMFASVRNELEAQLAVIGREQPAERPAWSRNLTDRAVTRLTIVREKIGQLLASSPVSEQSAGVQVSQSERDFLTEGARLSAILYLSLTLPLYILGLIFMAPWLDSGSSLRWIVNIFVAAAASLYLWRARGRLSEDRILAVVLATSVFGVVIVSFNQVYFAHLHMVYEPFLGLKLSMVLLGIVAGTRTGYRAAFIVATGVVALALFFGLDLRHERELIPLSEPWLTLVYMAIGLAITWMGERRRRVSIDLLRARTRLVGLRRRALMFLSLRDQLNSPLQTLVLCNPASRGGDDRVQEGIQRLADVSRRLASVDDIMPDEIRRERLDAERELSRHL
jgi:hypothetical protein